MHPRSLLPGRSGITRAAIRFVAVLVLNGTSAFAAVKVASPFGDHMVLQRGKPIPVWGTADAGERVSVEFGGRTTSTVADTNGNWRVNLSPQPANAEGADLIVSSVTRDSQSSNILFQDVLVGEVWLCGGQSNMERQLGLRSGQKPIVDWEKEVAAADHPLIRQLYVKQQTAFAPQTKVEAKWTVCSPETVSDFTAVGYFFARDLHAKLGVPVGIIHSSWGGTPAEAWTSAEGLREIPDFTGALAMLKDVVVDAAGVRQRYTEKLAQWYRDFDPGSRGPSWSEPSFDTAGWETMTLPVAWESAGHPDFDGLVWFRKTFDLPASWKGGDVELRLSAIDDVDTTWVNGHLVGATSLWNIPRVYRVPASALKATGNVIAVRVLDTGGFGGIYDTKLPFEVAALDGAFKPVSLAGAWQCKFAVALDAIKRPPQDITSSPGTPTVLYNGMIAPIVPYAIRGVTFYQGEANADRSVQYRTLFPALIADWRRQWNEGDFPFLFVQIAPYSGQPPSIREAQLLAWQATKNTAMIVTIDCGDADDIHPAHKQPVGARLALAARALAYGEAIEYSGPVYASSQINDGRAVISFSHLGGGLVAKDGPLSGFTIAGADGVFHPAKAEISGDTVVVSSADVAQPVAVRYGWANVASGNLFNQAGLPASPFRTDVK